MTQELKLCPFCGGEAELDIVVSLYIGYIDAEIIKCINNECGARTENYYDKMMQ